MMISIAACVSQSFVDAKCNDIYYYNKRTLIHKLNFIKLIYSYNAFDIYLHKIYNLFNITTIYKKCCNGKLNIWKVKMDKVQYKNMIFIPLSFLLFRK